MTLTSTDLLLLLPLIIVGTTAVVVMTGIAIKRHHTATAAITFIGLLAGFVSLFPAWKLAPEQVTPLLMIDGYSIFFMGLTIISTMVCVPLAHAYLRSFPDRREEFYILLTTSALGALTLVTANHFASLFIGLELLSVPLYGMVAYTFRDEVSLEGGIKYLVLSGAASAALLFGMALIYAVSGSLSFSELAPVNSIAAPKLWLLIGMGFIVISFGFKTSLVPFHLWTPDVYQGAPGPAAAYISTVSKLAAFAVLLRIFMSAPSASSDWLLGLVAVIAFLSMIIGNVLAVRQNDIKRLLGYSSIGHMGYLLTMVASSGGLAVEATGVYLLTYIPTMLGAFGVVSLISSPYSGTDASGLHNFRGLFWRRPYLAAVLTTMMLSLAGIPMTAGYIGKFYALATGMQAGLWWLVFGIIFGSAIGLYYYLRVTIFMFVAPPGHARRDVSHGWTQDASGIMVLLIAAAVVFLGLYPTPFINLIEAATMVG